MFIKSSCIYGRKIEKKTNISASILIQRRAESSLKLIRTVKCVIILDI